MRIIGGSHKRRPIKGPPESSTTRPIPDMVREAVFNLLRGHFEDVEVYDGFAGVGTFSLEAISRGAKRAVAVERDIKVAAVLEANAESLGMGDQLEIVKGDALGVGSLARCPRGVHVVFFDPPYAMVRDEKVWPRVRAQFERLIERLDDTGYAILRTPWPAVHGKPRTLTDEEEQSREKGAVAVDLVMKGAIGPETHDYGSTAVHLYMRDPAFGSPGADKEDG